MNLTGVGNWQRSIEVDPLDDGTNVWLLVGDAENGVDSDGVPLRLSVRCMSKETAVFVIWRKALTNHGFWKKHEVIVRVGEGKARAERWVLSGDNGGTFASQPIEFLKELLDHERLAVRVRDKHFTHHTAVFDISGLREVLPPLANACGWQVPPK